MHENMQETQNIHANMHEKYNLYVEILHFFSQKHSNTYFYQDYSQFICIVQQIEYFYSVGHFEMWRFGGVTFWGGTFFGRVQKTKKIFFKICNF